MTQLATQLAVNNFVETQNAIAFKIRLETELDPATRATLLELLLGEKAKFAALTEADRYNRHQYRSRTLARAGDR